jgi:hypothetical protein
MKQKFRDESIEPDSAGLVACFVGDSSFLIPRQVSRHPLIHFISASTSIRYDEIDIIVLRVNVTGGRGLLVMMTYLLIQRGTCLAVGPL